MSMAPLNYASKFDPFLSLDCASHPPSNPVPKDWKGTRDEILPSGNLGGHGRGTMKPQTTRGTNRNGARHDNNLEEWNKKGDKGD